LCSSVAEVILGRITEGRRVPLAYFGYALGDHIGKAVRCAAGIYGVATNGL